MFERFSSQARTAVTDAQDLARTWHTGQIGTAHLLAAAVSVVGPEPTHSVAARALARLGIDADAVLSAAEATVRCDTLDAEALAHLGIDLDEVRTRTDATFGPGSLDRAGQVTGRRGPSHIPMDASAKKMLEIALREAIHAGHKTIDTGHLLLAAVRLTDTSAYQVLTALGLDAAAVRAAVASTWSDETS
ncbi:MAG: hypothetical protein FWD11_01710 [Micrococcales bacterium]|nr:hypothetical protein [Micrococcales bacterium]